MAVHLTAAEARALFGLGAEAVVAGAIPASRTRPRRKARGPYASECYDCGQAFTTQASETRHLNATGHARYQLRLTLTPAVYDPPMSYTPDDPDPADPLDPDPNAPPK